MRPLNAYTRPGPAVAAAFATTLAFQPIATVAFSSFPSAQSLLLSTSSSSRVSLRFRPDRRAPALAAAKDDTEQASAFDPLLLGEALEGAWDRPAPRRRQQRPRSREARCEEGAGGETEGDEGSTTAFFGGRRRQQETAVAFASSASLAAAAASLLAVPNEALAAISSPSITIPSKLTTDFNPENFRPVCSASDNFYRLLQGTTEAVVGPDAFREYGPLIAGGLLRVRLELCVVESFFNEAVGPFVEANGLSWVLPLHETVETFLAGTIFALATTFILVGSTKLIAVIAVYGDAFVGGPCRLFGGFLFDRALGRPVTLDVGLGPWKTRLVGPPREEGEAEKEAVNKGGRGATAEELGNLSPGQIPVVVASGAVKYLGEGSKIVREAVEALDLFVGRYLVIIATGYIGFKFLHFKVFPDFPPF